MTPPAPNGEPAAAVPTISIESCGVAVPAWFARLVVGAVATAVLVVTSTYGAPVAVMFIGGLLAASCVLSPGSAAPAALGGMAAFVPVVYGAGAQLRPELLALVFLVHLLHVSSGVAAVLPRGARLHLSALRRTGLRFLAVQATVFALAGLAVVLPGGRNPWHLEVLAVISVAGLAAFALVLLRRR